MTGPVFTHVCPVCGAGATGPGTCFGKVHRSPEHELVPMRETTAEERARFSRRDPFSDVMGRQRGSHREDPLPPAPPALEPGWWRAMSDDPRFLPLVKFLDDCWKAGLRWAEVLRADEAGPGGIYAYPSNYDRDVDYDRADPRDLDLLDYHRDRLLELWPGVQLLTPPPAGGIHGGWLWDDGTGIEFD
jgi:hypothetical protein